LLHEQKNFVLLLTEQNRYRVAAGQNPAHLSWQNLGNLEHHVIGQDIAGTLVLVSSHVIAPGIEELQAQQLETKARRREKQLP